MANIDKEIQTIQTSIYGNQITESIVNGLTAVNNEVETLSSDQQTFEANITGQLETASTSQSAFEATINNQIESSNNDIAAMKEVVDNSKEIINNAGDLAQKVATLGSTIVNSTNDNVQKFNDINSTVQRINLIPDSNFQGDYANNGIAGSGEYAIRHTGYQLEAGKKYMFSAKANVTKELNAQGGHVQIAIQDDTFSNDDALMFFNSLTPTTQSVVFIPTTTQYFQAISYTVVNGEIVTTCSGITSWYCLVEGDIASDKWMPCPLDLDGGINLFGNSNFGSVGNTTSVNGVYWNTTEVELLANEPYTFTASASSENNTNNSGALCLMYNSDWSQSVNLFFEPTNNPKIMSVTFIPTKTDKYNFGFYSRAFDGTGYNINCTLYWYTLVHGSKRKAWLPSIADIKGKTPLQLAAIGKQTTQMMLAQTNTQKQTQGLGVATSQLMLENNQLKAQVKSLAQIIIEMKLNK
ncbi:MAG: hypothetical protein ACRCWG_03080 [Sarcina sp.]